MNDELKRMLLDAGASVVGFASVKQVLGDEIAHLERAVSIGVRRNLNEDSLEHLVSLQKAAASFLKSRGFRYLVIPPDSDRITNTFISKLYTSITHKIAATSAGIGWIGKNGLLINEEYGPRLSLGTVLTDAPVDTGDPVEESRCGECGLCVEHCPSQALTGASWSREEPYTELIKLERCSTHKKKSRRLQGKPNCGLCITICPYGRKNGSSEKSGTTQSDLYRDQ